ncbi:MAG TPA: tetratricopeptide repeat protein [Chitinophagales bacterium]|nr:tetratricopeptide repeat protein [Chitinophagales bacterium]
MRYLSFCLLLTALLSCTSQKDTTNEEIKSNLELANKSFNENKLDTAAVKNAEAAIGKYIQEYPQDSLSAGYLFELGNLYQKQRKFEQAINAFDKLYREYPDSKHARNAVFLQGFLYANVLNNLDKAKEKYELYLDKYSSADEKMTNDVQIELQNLGKTPDELLKEIQAKEAAKDTL